VPAVITVSSVEQAVSKTRTVIAKSGNLKSRGRDITNIPVFILMVGSGSFIVMI
jgi:hypothetical protein